MVPAVRVGPAVLVGAPGVSMLDGDPVGAIDEGVGPVAGGGDGVTGAAVPAVAVGAAVPGVAEEPIALVAAGVTGQTRLASMCPADTKQVTSGGCDPHGLPIRSDPANSPSNREPSAATRSVAYQNR